MCLNQEVEGLKIQISEENGTVEETDTHETTALEIQLNENADKPKEEITLKDIHESYAKTELEMIGIEPGARPRLPKIYNNYKAHKVSRKVDTDLSNKIQ